MKYRQTQCISRCRPASSERPSRLACLKSITTGCSPKLRSRAHTSHAPIQWFVSRSLPAPGKIHVTHGHRAKNAQRHTARGIIQ